jgi:hypothetical protein
MKVGCQEYREEHDVGSPSVEALRTDKHLPPIHGIVDWCWAFAALVKMFGLPPLAFNLNIVSAVVRLVQPRFAEPTEDAAIGNLSVLWVAKRKEPKVNEQARANGKE